MYMYTIVIINQLDMLEEYHYNIIIHVSTTYMYMYNVHVPDGSSGGGGGGGNPGCEGGPSVPVSVSYKGP